MKKAIIFFIICTFSVSYGQSLDQEVEIQCKKIIDSFYLKRGNNYYSFTKSYDTYGDYEWRGYTHELSALSFKIVNETLTYADTLNLFEWKGELQITCKAYRTIYSEKWSEWSLPASAAIIKIRKKRGSWRYDIERKGSFLGEKKPTLEIVEKLLKLPMQDSY